MPGAGYQNNYESVNPYAYGINNTTNPSTALGVTNKQKRPSASSWRLNRGPVDKQN